MFAIGDEEWPGVSKVLEEKDELGVELGKLMGTRGDTNHWSGDLRPKIVDETADLFAALTFFSVHNFTDEEWEYMNNRILSKLETYDKWQEENPAPPTK